MDESAELIQIGLYGIGIDDEVVDHAGQPLQCKIERYRGIGAENALDR